MSPSRQKQYPVEPRGSRHRLGSEPAISSRSALPLPGFGKCVFRACAALVLATALGCFLPADDVQAATATASASAHILSLGMVTVAGIPNTLQITPRDLRRGYVDVPLRITSTVEGGYFLSTRVAGGAFSTGDAAGGSAACNSCAAGTQRLQLGNGTPASNAPARVFLTVNNY